MGEQHQQPLPLLLFFTVTLPAYNSLFYAQIQKPLLTCEHCVDRVTWLLHRYKNKMGQLKVLL